MKHSVFFNFYFSHSVALRKMKEWNFWFFLIRKEITCVSWKCQMGALFPLNNRARSWRSESPLGGLAHSRTNSSGILVQDLKDGVMN